MSGRSRVGPALLVLLSALLHALSFPPLGFFPLAWLSLVPFFVGLTRVRPLAGASLGLIWSLGVGLGTAQFLPSMISDYFSTGVLTAWGTATLATLWTGLWYGAFGGWLAWLSRAGPPGPFTIACGFGACEYGRTISWLANPWALSATTQAPWLHALQLADLGGPVVIGMALAAFNACIANSLLLAPTPRCARPALLGVAVLAATVGYGEWRLRQDFSSGAAVEVALVQGAVPRDQRWNARFRSENLARQLALAEQAERVDTDLILFSELAFDFPFEQGRSELTRAAARGHADWMVGAEGVLDLLVLRRQFNSFYVVRGNEIVDRYDKVALMPFSETNPFRGVVDLGRDSYSRGAAHRPVESSVGPVGVLLCNEAMLPHYARIETLRGAGLLANPANDEWFGRAGAAHQLAIVALRAVENRRYLVRPTLTGFTAVVDPFGRVIERAAYGAETVLTASVHTSNAVTPYHRIHDALPLSASGFALAVTLRSARRGNSRGGRAC